MGHSGIYETPNCWKTTFLKIYFVCTKNIANSSDLYDVEVERIIQAVFTHSDFSIQNYIDASGFWLRYIKNFILVFFNNF
jgi:hypothetical protein